MNAEPVRILLLEDNPDDVKLIQRALDTGGIVATSHVVGDELAFRTALAAFAPQLILAEYSLPGFAGPEAEAITREWDPAVPCIFVSGAMGDELAVTALHSGATDFVLKHRLELLPPAIRRALDEAAERGERHRLEAALRQFQEMTTETFDRMPLGFVALDHERRVTYANPAALEPIGLSLAEVTGRRVWDVLPEIAGRGFEMADDPTAAGAPFESEEYIAPHDRWVDVLACPTSMGAAVFLLDITDRKRAEAAVRASEAAMRGSLEAMLDPFLICSSIRDASGAIVDLRVDFANRAAGAFMGRALETLSLRGRPFCDVVREVVESGEGWSEDAVEFAAPGRDGDQVHGLVNIQIAKFGDGFFATWRDVTERERTRLERERLVAVVGQTIDGVLITDAEGTITYANPAFLAANGLALDDLVGRPAKAIAVEVIGRHAIAGFEKAALAGKPRLEEIERKRGDGTTSRQQISMTPVRDAGGTVTSFVVIARDVTHVREVEADLAFEATLRTVLAAALLETRPGDTLERAVELICDKLATLPGIDYAGVEGFDGETGVVVVASHVPEGFTLARGTRIPPEHAAYLRERVKRGPWSEYWAALPEDGAFSTLMADIGLKALAIGPITHGDHVDGLLAIGTRQKAFAQAVVEKMPALVSFSTASSALLAERLHARRLEAERRASLTSILATAAFYPVFQPIVDLDGREVVGYEALTRFDSGPRPAPASPTPGRPVSGPNWRSPPSRRPLPLPKDCRPAAGSASTSRRACWVIASASAPRCGRPSAPSCSRSPSTT